MKERYCRQCALEGFGEESLAKLAQAHVCIIGAGGVASGAIPTLAGSGIGHLTIIDPDSVSEHNLHRQIIYRQDQVGIPKAELAAQYAMNLNPHCKAQWHKKFFEANDAKFLDEFFKGCTICIDTSDTFASRLAVSDECKKRGVKLIMASAENFISQIMLFGENFYLSDVISQDCASEEKKNATPIFAPSASLSGLWAASEAIRHIATSSKFEIGKFIYFDSQQEKFIKSSLI